MNIITSILRAAPRRFAFAGFAAGSAFAAVLVTGCASHQRAAGGPITLGSVTTPPLFLTGPASALLINPNGFSTRLSLKSPGEGGEAHPLEGRLLCRGSRMLFAPAGSDRIFLWDVRQHCGYVLSEALQGYAPISSSILITNVAATGNPPSTVHDRVNGHAGRETEVAVALNDGSTAAFTVWCAADLDGFPVRIRSQNAAGSFDLNLYEVRAETLAPTLFLPPEDFTKYPSAEVMDTELMTRKSKLRGTAARPAETARMPGLGSH